jgi:hypothetical protein
VKPEIVISLLTDTETRPIEFGRRVAEVVYGRREITPEFVNTFEPINRPGSSVEDLLALWPNDPVHWRRRRPQCLGTVYHRNSRSDAALIIHCKSPDVSQDWLGLFADLAEAWAAYYGFLHLFTDEQMEPSAIGSGGSQDFYLGAFSHDFDRGLPDMGWASYFGRKQRSELDEARIAAAGFEVRPSRAGAIVLTTSNLRDIADGLEGFTARRSTLKSLFRPGLFRTDI